MSKFVIFAIARSGSTSLAKLLGNSLDVRMLIEPFHEAFAEWSDENPNYKARIHDERNLDLVLSEIYEKYTAIKVLNYQLDTYLYKHLFSTPDLKIIFLYRHNLIDSFISAEVAKQTSVWHHDELNLDTKERYRNLKPLDVEHIKKSYEYVIEQRKVLLDFLYTHKKGNYLELFYEDLYSDKLERNAKTIKEICSFLNVREPDLKFVKKYMSISSGKINQDKLYESAPNYRQIKEMFREYKNL